MSDQVPATATEARATLDTRIADKAFGDRLFAGDAGARKELDTLHAKIHAGGADVVAAAMSGNLGDVPSSDLRVMAGTADLMRDLGFQPKAIQETLSDAKPTAEDVERARSWKAQVFKNAEWVNRFLTGDGEARREMMAADIVLSSHARETAAS